MTSNYRFGGRRAPQIPPPVPKKPSLQERQKRHELRAAMEGQFTPAPPAPPPPIGYNDADRFYVASPPPTEFSLELDQELDIYPEKPGTRSANDPQSSTWLSRKLNQMDSKAGERQRNGQPKSPRHAQTDTKDLRNDDENRRRRLEEQLGDLKAENRAKSRELKTNKYIENEMNRKLKTADDAYLLRHTVKDKDRAIANQDKLIAELTAENARLAESLTERDRQVFELQSEVDNLDRVIVAKKALREAERLQAMGEDLDKTRDELAGANFEVETAKNELKNMQSVVNRKDREIKSKSEQIDQLSRQLILAETKIAALENEKAVADNHCKEANREAKLLKDQKDKLVDFKERCHNLEEENAYMTDAIRTLEAKVLQLEAIKHDKEVLDDLVQDLKLALKDKNQIAKDRRDLVIETQQLKEILREKTVDEQSLQRELEKLKDVLNELEKENNFFRDLEVDFRRVKQKYEEVEKERFKNELVLSKLRPRVERLQNRCKEKDDLIRRLANELRAGGDRLPRDLLQEADRNQNNAVNDYIDLNDYLDDEPLSAQVRRSRDRRPYNSAQRSPMSAYEPVKGTRRLSPSPSRQWGQPYSSPHPQDPYSYSHQQPEHQFSNRPNSKNELQQSRTEPQMSGRSPARYNDDQRPRVDQPRHNDSQQPRTEQPPIRVPPPTAWEIPHHESVQPRKNQLTASNDVHEEAILPKRREEDEYRQRATGYSPTRIPTRDDYAREEPVRQHPRQFEQANPQSRYEQGSRPKNDMHDPHVQELNQRPSPREGGAEGANRPDLVRSDTFSVLDQPPPAASQFKEPIQEAKKDANEPYLDQQRQNPEQLQQPQQSQQYQLEPPTNVRAIMQPDSDSLLVEWDAPQLDELDRNNGMVVSGYKVFINGVEQQPIVSSRVTKLTLPMVEIGNMDINALRISVQSCCFDGTTSDRANLSLAPQQPEVDRHLHPSNLQPSPRPAGPVSPLTVQVDRPGEQQTSGHSDHRQNHYNDHSPRGPYRKELGQQHMEDRFRTRDNSPNGAAARLGPPPQPYARKALYDYQPSDHSPSAFPPFELELHKGDEVQTFGPVRPDGMYNSEVNGKRGLVPAQYLQLD